MESQNINAKNRIIMQATEAGKDIELRLMRESTPKQKDRVMRIPIGTKSHEVRDFLHDI